MGALSSRRFKAIGLAAAVASSAFASSGGAQDDPGRPLFVVSPNGDDAGPGTEAQPWRTISKAARSATPGAIVDIRGGTYAEQVSVEVSGEPGRPVTFRERPGEQVVVTGGGSGLGGSRGLIHIEDQSHLELVGIEIRDVTERSADRTPAGVWIRGAGSNITLRGLDVHDIRTTARTGDAHGIAVYGTSGDRPLSGISIEASSVHDLRLGTSEAIAVNGNVDGFRIAGNVVDDVNNIAIDAIGFEETAPRNDQARNGVIADNAVSDVDTRGNPGYEEEDGNCRCAGGIYVDGGRSIVIERNRVSRANLGVELASEHRNGTTSDILMRNNLVTQSHRAGLTMGGFDSRRGSTRRVTVVNNTFLDNDRLREDVGEVELNFRVFDSRFLNNAFRARRAAIMVTNDFRQNRGNVFDGNVWFAPRTSARSARWQWRTHELRGFAAWRRAIRGDARGRYANPLVGPDGRPLAGSPLIDAGIATDLAGETDLAGAPRMQGAAIDAGAFETPGPRGPRRAGQ